jgi:hypothetical protein
VGAFVLGSSCRKKPATVLYLRYVPEKDGTLGSAIVMREKATVARNRVGLESILSADMTLDYSS